MPVTSTIILVLATTATGLTAGVFAIYSNAVMPGLGATNDPTFVGAFQSIDRAIINPVWLGGGFFGALVLTAAAAGFHIGSDSWPAFAWIVTALVLHALVILITIVVHLPLNDAIKSAGDPALIDAAAARTAFMEARWVAWNGVRVALDVAATVALCLALVAHGRIGG